MTESPGWTSSLYTFTKPLIERNGAPTVWIASSLPRLAMTLTQPRRLATRMRPSFAKSLSLENREGAGNAGRPMHP
jgi:hypothetical protein